MCDESVYPRGWCKIGGPLPDGYYWWRYDEDDPRVIRIVANGMYPGHGRMFRDFEIGEWCGPIPEPDEEED